MAQLTKPTTTANLRWLRIGILGMFGLLVVQFIAGMYLNFYVEMPESHPGISGSYAPSIPWALAGHAGTALAVHVITWILLTVGAITLVVRGVKSKQKSLIVGTSLGLLFILMAGSGGLTFLNRGGSDRDSFTMALSFLLSLLAYGFTFYATKAVQK